MCCWQALTRAARQLPPVGGSSFAVSTGRILFFVWLFVLVLCCLCICWYIKRTNMRYEYLRAQRAKDLEKAGDQVGYAQYKSEDMAEDASLLLRPARIDISQSVSSSGGSSSELGGRGANEQSSSSSSASEVGRSESSDSELGARDNDAKQSSSSSAR